MNNILRTVSTREHLEALGAMILESGQTQHPPSALIEFCMEYDFASLLYALSFSPSKHSISCAQINEKLKESYHREWASCLRYDTIRRELHDRLVAKEGLSCLFLDLAVANRIESAKPLITKCEQVNLLIHKHAEFHAAGKHLRSLGFLRFNPNRSVPARILRTAFPDHHLSHFKRNNFIVAISQFLPIMYGQAIDPSAMYSRRRKVSISNVDLPCLSLNDDLAFRLLVLLDTLLLDQDFATEMVDTFLSAQMQTFDCESVLHLFDNYPLELRPLLFALLTFAKIGTRFDISPIALTNKQQFDSYLKELDELTKQGPGSKKIKSIKLLFSSLPKVSSRNMCRVLIGAGKQS